MISIRHDMTSNCAIYALAHFLDKHGVEARVNEDEKADIEIRCADSGEKDACAGILIQIFTADIERQVKGYLEANAENIPLFETPRRLRSDRKTIATFHGEGSSYPCAIIDGNCLEIGFDIFSEIGHILSGHLESVFDELGSESKKLMQMPVVDALEELLFSSLELICREKGVDLDTKPFWPGGKKFTLCLTHDVDRVYKTYQYIPSILRGIRRRDLSVVAGQIRSALLGCGKSNPYWNFDRIMKLENDLGVKSTFFFLGESGKPSLFNLKSWILFTGRYRIDDPNIAETIRRLYNNGFEVGVHGSYYSYKDPGLLGEEKRKLENVIGDRVHGIRQHYLNFDYESTFEIQESLGFGYDSTLGFRKGVGFRRGTSFPYQPLLGGGGTQSSLLEIPLIIMDSALPNEGILENCVEMMEIVEKHGGVLTLLWHQRMFNDEEFPGMVDLYKRLVVAARAKDAWITNAYGLYEWLMYERQGAKSPVIRDRDAE